MKLIKILNLLLFVALAQNCLAVIVSVSVYSKDNKKVIVIGDRHIVCREEQMLLAEEQQYHPVLLNFIQLLAQGGNAGNSSSIFHLELNKFGLDLLITRKKSNKGQYAAISALGLFAHSCDYKLQNLKFKLSDNRPPLCSTITAILGSTRNPFDFKEVAGEGKTLINLAQDFASCIAVLKEQLGIIPGKDYFLGELDSDYKAFLLAVAEFDDKPFLDVFAECKDKEKLEKLRNSIVRLGSLLVEINYLINLVNSLETHDTIVFYVGNLHVKMINHMLGVVLKYTLVSQDGDLGRPDMNNFTRISKDRLQEIFGLKVAQPDERRASECKQESKVGGAPCANFECKKEGTKRCGRCKKMQYCSAECQKAHWKVHKLNCLPGDASGEASAKREALAESGKK